MDAQTCKLIVIDKNIETVSEFKQIIGRGTRIHEDQKKFYFTIMDFRGATSHFFDPDFDGVPLDGSKFDPKPDRERKKTPERGPGMQRFFVDNVEVNVVAKRVQYLGGDGQPITESLRDYTRKNVTRQYATIDAFLNTWTKADQKTAIIAEMEAHGVFFDALEEEVGQEFDPFDLVCYIAYGQPALSRKQRAAKVRNAKYFDKYGDQVREVLNELLDKYSDGGIADIESMEVLRVDPLNKFGTPMEIVNTIFGGKTNYLEAIRRLERCLYTAEC